MLRVIGIDPTVDFCSIDEVRDLFVEPEFREAAGVLEMISQTPGQFHEYAARQKLRLDDAARILYAQEEGERKGHEKGLREGEAKGEQRGLLLGRIAVLQEAFSIAAPALDELANYDLARLNALLEELQNQFRNRDR